MAIVLLVAVATWAAVAAERTRSNKARFHTHYHANGVPHDRKGEWAMTPEWVPFGPVYWRALLGLPWNWHYVCVPGNGRRAIVCEVDFPQVSHKGGLILTDHPRLFDAFDGQLQPDPH